MELCGGTHVVSTGDIGLLKYYPKAYSCRPVKAIGAVTGSDSHRLNAKSNLTSLVALAAMLKKLNQVNLTCTDHATIRIKNKTVVEKGTCQIKAQYAPAT